MKLSSILSFVLAAAFAAVAQNQAPIQKNWFPQAIESLGQNATSHTEFSLDRSMLVMASKQDQNDDSLRRVIAGVDGISVQRFHYPGAGMYDPQVLNEVRHEYSEAGWQHISKAHDKYGYPGGTDLWVHLEHNTIRNIAVLFARDSQVNFISVSGSISPIDLLHLAGHFGIPKIEGGVVVPAPGDAPATGPYGPQGSQPVPPTNN